MPIVTISRETGAYGNFIATTIARTMDLEIATRDKIHELVLSCHPEYTCVCEMYESEHGPGWAQRIFAKKSYFASVFESLACELASRGDVVIVGRGASVVLRGNPGVFSLRVVAPSRVRVRRIMERHRISEKEAKRFISKFDSERENLIRAVFDADIDDWRLYDMILNTERFSSSTAAEMAIQTIQQMEQASDEPDLRETLHNMALAKRIETIIRRKMSFFVSPHLNVAAESGGRVIISGRVLRDKDKKTAIEIAQNYPGVTHVEAQFR